MKDDPIDEMARFECPPDQFLPKLLEAACLAAGASHAGVLGMAQADGSAWLACHPADVKQHRDEGAWLHRAQQAIDHRPPTEVDRVGLYNNTGQQLWAQIVTAPLFDLETRELRAVLCLFLESAEDTVGREAVRHLDRATQVVARYELGQVLLQREGDLRGLSQAMQVLDAVNREPHFKPAGIALCEQIADTWQASRVAVGFLAGQTIKLRAMSHTEDIIRKMQAVQDLEAAMEECVDQDSEVMVPPAETATTINRQANTYVAKHGPAHLCVLPLRLRDKVVGAMSVEWPNDQKITSEQVESLRLAANLFTARLYQFHLDDRWFGARLTTSMRKTFAVAVGPKHTWAKLVAIAVFAFLVFAFLFKGNDTVDSSFTVQTTQRQIITAPFEGTLLRVGEGIEVNETVVGLDRNIQAGQATVLAVMDTSELKVNRAQNAAEIVKFQAEADAARGEGDLAAVEIAMANVSRLQAQAELYDYRIERSTLTSPTSGVIIEGDLRQRINGTLEKGEVLFEIAPLKSLRAELLVPASRIGDVRSRMEHPDNPSEGELASASHPGEFIGFTVERIEPEAEVVNGKNVFRVRVSLDKRIDWLRPGVEGEAKIHVTRRSFAHLWTRDATNWVRMKLWL